jgi:UPF0755 protein
VPAIDLGEEHSSVLRLTLQALKVAAIATVALLTLFFGQRLFNSYLERARTTEASPVLFTIEPDESTDSVGARLADLGLIRSTTYFKGKVRLRGADTKMKAGSHSLREGMSVDEILDTITVVVSTKPGTPVTTSYVQYTTIEGWRTEQIAQLLLDNGLIKDREQFYAALKDPSLSRYEFLANRPAGAGLEGFLFPDTYRVPQGVPTKDIVTLMLDDFDRRVPRNMRENTPEGFSFYQALIVASIVEREAAIDSERSVIASVYYNRLRSTPPLRLQADPTVQYAVGQDGNWWPELGPPDLRRESPYNTYLVNGLPPGPICNPSLKSIQAALSPAQTDYLYFVAKGDGTHAFARTYDEHLENVRKYQR